MSQQPKPQYMFYASLLDAYQEFLDTNVEEFFYQDENGAWHKNYSEETEEYHLSADEVYDLALQQFLDKINRVEHEPSEAADKGTAFNEILDCLIERREPGIDGMVIRTIRSGADLRAVRIVTYLAELKQKDGAPIGEEENDALFAKIGKPFIYASFEGFEFFFDIDFCREAAKYFKGSLCQVYMMAPIRTKYGLVDLYGYADYVRENKVYDAKTTKRYDFGKYEKKWQKHLYPYCLITNKKCTEVKEFEYTCFKLSGGTSRSPLITGQMYPEVYTFDYESSKSLIVQHCERLIEFLNEHKSAITDKKVFGGVNE